MYHIDAKPTTVVETSNSATTSADATTSSARIRELLTRSRRSTTTGAAKINATGLGDE